MPKKISFTTYTRKRGLTKQKAPFSLKTPTGKLASSYNIYFGTQESIYYTNFFLDF